MNFLSRSPRDIGHALREARRDRGWSQKELAERCGLWQETISKIERGAGGTKLDSLFDLLAALDLELTVRDRSKGSQAALEDIF